MKRMFDLFVTVTLLTIVIIPMLIIACLVKLTSKGPVMHWSYRVGINNKIFKMPKFRTMRIDTPEIATHLLEHPDKYLTSIGVFLRKFSLDELPQLASVLKNDMSLVGPRPALYNQEDLITMRTEKHIHILKPGITGWAQVNGRDELPIHKKVEYDEYYLNNRSFVFDLKILWMTFFYVIEKKGISH